MKAINFAQIDEIKYLSELTDAFIIALNAMARRYIKSEGEPNVDLTGEIEDEVKLSMMHAVSFLRKLIITYEDEEEVHREREISKALIGLLLIDEIDVGTIQERLNKLQC